MHALSQFGTRSGTEWIALQTTGVIAIVVLIASWLACAGFAATVARAKGYDRGTWGFLGLVFGAMALIAAVGLPSRASSTNVDLGQPKPCPDCARQCPLEARICGQCKFEFARNETVQLMCRALQCATPARKQMIADHIRNNWDAIAIEELIRAGKKTGWPELTVLVPLLIAGGAGDRLDWLANRMLKEFPGELSTEASRIASDIANMRTEHAAQLLIPMLGRHYQIPELLVRVGPAAIPALQAFAGSAEKRLAKQATGVASLIEKGQKPGA